MCNVACLASRLFCLSVMLALSSQYCSCFGVNHSVIYFILTSWTLLHMLFLSPPTPGIFFYHPFAVLQVVPIHLCLVYGCLMGCLAFILCLTGSMARVAIVPTFTFDPD